MCSAALLLVMEQKRANRAARRPFVRAGREKRLERKWEIKYGWEDSAGLARLFEVGLSFFIAAALGRRRWASINLQRVRRRWCCQNKGADTRKAKWLAHRPPDSCPVNRVLISPPLVSLVAEPPWTGDQNLNFLSILGTKEVS